MKNLKIASESNQIKAFLIKSGIDSPCMSPKNPARAAIKINRFKKNNSSSFLRLHEIAG